MIVKKLKIIDKNYGGDYPLIYDNHVVYAVTPANSLGYTDTLTLSLHRCYDDKGGFVDEDWEVTTTWIKSRVKKALVKMSKEDEKNEKKN